ncbi:MAG TPA: DUF4351 domain-containing protein [Gammaproteobacteria bacterium]|nr:DUF4351 domain-containing protein [Gammaproteobacteria bacterium]
MNNRFAMVMLAQLAAMETKHDPKTRLIAKTHLTRLLYQKGYKKQDIIRLFALIDWLITLPEELMLEYNEVVKQIEEEKHVQFVTTPERVAMMKLAAALIRLLQRRFGQLSPDYLNQIQQARTDALLIWIDWVLDATSLEEVFS